MPCVQGLVWEGLSEFLEAALAVLAILPLVTTFINSIVASALISGSAHVFTYLSYSELLGKCGK